MIHKITSIWPNLVRPIPSSQSQAAESEQDKDHDGEEGSGSQSEEDDEEALLELYSNLYWTRLVTIENIQYGVDRKFPLGPDLVEEL